MLKLREFDCGTWNDFAGINRITVRERPDGLYDLLHIRHTHTVAGMQKSESPCGIFKTLDQAREAGWALWRQLSDIG